MASHPKPVGYNPNSAGEDFGFVRNLDGHIGVNVNGDPEMAANIAYRRNEKTFTEANLGGEYD